MGEPMVTIKKADGSTQRVPLSQVRSHTAVSSDTSAPPAPSTSAKNIQKTANDGDQITPEKNNENSAPQPSPVMAKRSPAIASKSVGAGQSLKQKPASPAASVPNMEKKYASFDRQAPVKQGAQQAVKKTTPPDITNVPKPRRQPPVWGTDDHVSLLDDSLHTDLPMTIDHNKTQLSTTAPVKDIFENEAKYATQISDNKYQISNNRQQTADNKEQTTDNKKQTADNKEQTTDNKKQTADNRLQTTDYRQQTTDNRLQTTVDQRKNAGTMPNVARPASTGKPVMHDVRPDSAMAAVPSPGSSSMPRVTPSSPPVTQAIKRSVGPVDELRAMRIEDFRRLGGTVPAMKEVFMNKFLGLRKESFMMYSDGVRAWRKSPLYQLYLRVIGAALRQKKPIDAVVTAEGMKKEEFEALVDVNMHLGM